MSSEPGARIHSPVKHSCASYTVTHTCKGLLQSSMQCCHVPWAVSPCPGTLRQKSVHLHLNTCHRGHRLTSSDRQVSAWQDTVRSRLCVSL